MPTDTIPVDWRAHGAKRYGKRGWKFTEGRRLWMLTAGFIDWGTESFWRVGICEPYAYLVGGEARPLLAEARDEITRLRELCGFLIDAAATHRISVPLNSSLLDLAADIAGGPALDAGDALNVGPDTTGEGT